MVLDGGREVSFSFAAMLSDHGGGSPGGVAHAFKVLERALPLLNRQGWSSAASSSSRQRLADPVPVTPSSS